MQLGNNALDSCCYSDDHCEYTLLLYKIWLIWILKTIFMQVSRRFVLPKHKPLNFLMYIVHHYLIFRYYCYWPWFDLDSSIYKIKKVLREFFVLFLFWWRGFALHPSLVICLFDVNSECPKFYCRFFTYKFTLKPYIRIKQIIMANKKLKA